MGRKVLIVDDDSFNLYLLESILKGYGGFEVILAENGEDALVKARLNLPDLIVSDILMPVMDGFTLCRECKSDDALKHIPFVFYTATYTETKDEAFALSLGAERFILKPQDADILMSILTEVLEESREVKQTKTKPLGEEMEFFRQHNEILFNKLEKKMLDLEVAHQKLKMQEEQYRLTFENVTDVIYLTDTDLKIMSVSPSVEKALGYKPGDFIGKPVSCLRHIFTPESFERAIANFSLIFKGERIATTIYEFVAKDGTIRHVEISGSPMMREGKIVGIVSVARDISERKRAEDEIRLLNEELEQRIKERTAQLETVNKELESFNYSVSHDLRAPLRSIDGFSQILLEDYGAMLDDQGKDYLGRLRRAAQRMGQLIEDLLKLSRVTRSDFQYEMVDLSALVRAVAEICRQNNPQQVVDLLIRDGVVVWGDANLLRIALMNLLENAWKFTSQTAFPRIEFGINAKDGNPVNYIRDNGAGFDMTYADKLFGAFQRLHGADKFPGTGIGLATVKRIINRHGGHIWAESELGRGATFYFTLPR